MIKLYQFTEDEKESFKKLVECFDNNIDNYRTYIEQLELDSNVISEELHKLNAVIERNENFFEYHKREMIICFNLYGQILNEKRYSVLTEEEKEARNFMSSILTFFNLK